MRRATWLRISLSNINIYKPKSRISDIISQTGENRGEDRVVSITAIIEQEDKKTERGEE